MAHFLNNRSCNDDFYILEPRITRSTCEPNELDKQNFVIDNTTTFAYANANIQFKEKINILPWINTEPDTRLEAIDAKLEQICAEEERKINNDNNHEEHEELCQLDDTDIINRYALENRLSHDEAIEYLKSCHYCGNTNIPFADEYCNERCQDYSIVYSYPCYRKQDCKVCDNWYRHFDHSNTNQDNDEDNHEDNISESNDTDCFPTMEQYYDSIDNNNNDDEQLPTTTSHCSLCDSYVYKNGLHCKPCIDYHGKKEFTNYIEFRCYDDNGQYLYDNENNTSDNEYDYETYEERLIRYAEEAETIEQEQYDGW